MSDGSQSLWSGIFLVGCLLVLAVSTSNSPAAGSDAITRLSAGWEFYRGSLGSAWEIWRGDKATDNVEWTPVTLPHCFNARDAVDPDARYYQGPGWYRRMIPWSCQSR